MTRLRTANKRGKKQPITLEAVRRIALALPGAEEGTSYGTPAFKVRSKLFTRLHQDGESLVVKIDFDARDILTEANPEAFYITDHYKPYPMMLVRLSTVRREELRELIETSWRRSAPKRLVDEYDERA